MDHAALAERGWKSAQNGAFGEAITDLKQAISAFPQSAAYHYQLGRVYWDTGSKKDAVNQFLESATIDPDQPDVFFRLGLYHQEQGDATRATRCYQKAVVLSPENASAGEALCNLLDKEAQYALEKNVCSEATQKSPRAFWAWRRLGYLQAAQKEWSQGVASVQVALRHFTRDARLWEVLGLCYHKLSMFTAALKAYGRSFEIDGSAAFCAIEMGNLHMKVSAHSKATECFRQGLVIAPGELSATYGLASSLLEKSRECFKAGAFAWASTLLEEAIQISAAMTMSHSHLASLWKLMGDSNLLYAQMVPFNEEEQVDGWKRKRMQAAQSAVDAFKQALHLVPQSGEHYRDLSIALELRSHLRETERRDSSQWSQAEIIICGGLKNDGGNADMWFTLGVVAQRSGLKQHAFVQALRLDGNHALAWSFLGQVYLAEGDDRLAKHCFDRGRSADSTLAFPWAGTAALRSATLPDAFATLSHALFLSSSVNLQVGLGHLAAKTHNLSLPQVYAVLEQGALREPLRAELHNLRGLCCESRGDLQSATSAFERARAFAGAKELTAIMHNLARVLCKRGNAAAAVAEYERLHSSGALREPHEVIGYAVSLWLSGNKDKAESLAKTATGLNGFANAEKRAFALALYGKTIYYAKGAAAALDVLSSVPEALFSHKELSLTMISIGLASGMPELLSKAIRSCYKVLLSENGPDANILLALGNQVQNSFVVSWNLRKSLHTFPQSDSLRAKLAEVLCSLRHAPPTLVERLCRTDSIFSSERSAIALADASVCGGKTPFKELQRLVHMEPYNVVARYCFVLVLIRRAILENYPSHLRELVIHFSTMVLPQLGSSEDDHYMRAQLGLCLSECTLRSGDPQAAIEHANGALQSARAPSIRLAATLQLARCFSLLHDNASASKALQRWDEQPLQDGDFYVRLCLFDMELRLKDGTFDRSSVAKVWQNVEPGRWSALLEFVIAKLCIRNGELEAAEAAALKAISIWQDNPVLQLVHGAMCVELARKNATFLPKAISSLSKAVQGKKNAEVPVACALLAQAELSRDSRAGVIRKWASNLRREYLTWPKPDSRPAELYFQMAMLVKQSAVVNRGEATEEAPESAHGYKAWLQRALHMNPTCKRYWTLLRSNIST